MDGHGKAPTLPYIAAYYAAIVAANLLAARFGALAMIVNALAFIGLDLVVRDYLHEFWSGRGLVWKMAALIASGSVLTWLISPAAGQIALASCVAFAAAAIADGVTYQLLQEKAHLVRVNGSNVISALVDSVVFPWVAFHGLQIWVTLGLFLAKVAGGFFWSLVLSWPPGAKLSSRRIEDEQH